MIYELKNFGVHMFKNEELIEVLKAEIQTCADKEVSIIGCVVSEVQ